MDERRAQGDRDDATLRDSARATLRGYLKLLGQLRRQIAEAIRELRRQVAQSEQGELWRSLPGISWVLAYTILAETGRIGRFQDGRRLCSYALVVPIADDSGDEDEAAPLGRHVGHIGRRTLKWALIEAARGAATSRGRHEWIVGRRDGPDRCTDKRRACEGEKERSLRAMGVFC